jgi:hypothetical protein
MLSQLDHQISNLDDTLSGFNRHHTITRVSGSDPIDVPIPLVVDVVKIAYPEHEPKPSAEVKSSDLFNFAKN